MGLNVIRKKSKIFIFHYFVLPDNLDQLRIVRSIEAIDPMSQLDLETNL